MQLVFYLPTFSTSCMSYLLHLMFRCDGDVMENDVFVGVFGGSKRAHVTFFFTRFQRLKFLNGR